MRIKKCEIRISIVCFLFGVNWILAQQNRVEFDLRGSVKEIRSTTYPSVNLNSTEVSGFLDSELYNSIYLKFDVIGNLILRENYLDYRGKLGLYDRSEFFYNSIGKLEKVETQLIQNGEEPKRISQRKIYYYLNNQLIRTDEFNYGKNNSQYWVINSEYKGGNISKKVYWMEDKIFSTNYLEYESGQNLSSENTVHNDGRNGLKVEYQYNSNDQLFKKISRSGNQTTTETFTYLDGKLKAYSKENADGIREIYETYTPDGNPNEIYKQNYQSQKQDVFTFGFQNDEKGNWTECIISKNGNPAFRILRNIQYY